MKLKEAMNPLGKDLPHITYITDVSNRRLGKVSVQPLTFFMPTCFNELACNCSMHNKCIGSVRKSHLPICYLMIR